MKPIVTINLASSWKNTSKNKEGAYCAELCCGDLRKQVIDKRENTSAYKLLLEGLLDGILSLNQPCDIKNNTPSKLGLNNKKAHADLKSKILKAIKEGQHDYHEEVTDDNSGRLGIAIWQKFNSKEEI